MTCKVVSTVDFFVHCIAPGSTKRDAINTGTTKRLKITPHPSLTYHPIYRVPIQM